LLLGLRFVVDCSSHGSSPKGEVKNEAPGVPEGDVNMTVVVADESFEATQLTAPADPPSSLEKKRKRDDDAPAVVTVATQELEGKLKAAQDQVSTLTEELEQTVQVKLNKLQQENLSLMARLEAATSENLQLKTDLAAKDESVDAKLKELRKTSEEALAAETAKFKDELAAKEKAMGLKIKEAVKRSLEEDHRAKEQEMAAKLKEATKKYQQKVEAEHFEQRREMSERMAAYANESEKLQTALGKKEDELAECEDKIASLGEKVAALEKQACDVAAKEAKLAEYEEKVGELEEKVSASKDESSEILGLLAAAEEKVVAAENKAAEAAIAAQAAASSNNGADATERKELQAAIVALRSELESYQAQMASREEEVRRQGGTIEYLLCRMQLTDYSLH
jgi:chromosome segregation ATPase